MKFAMNGSVSISLQACRIGEYLINLGKRQVFSWKIVEGDYTWQEQWQ